MIMNNRFEVKFDVIQTDKYEQGLSGSFEALGKGNESISADLSVIAQSSVKSDFEVIIGNQVDEGVQGSFETVGVGKRDVSGSFAIYPKNKMQVKFDVSAPPRSTKVLEAKKDVFVYEGNKSYNYGLWSYLQVGVNAEGQISRSFLDFDFAEFPSNVYITKATLVLVSKTRNAFEGLEISTANKEYDETNVVWGNQPVRQQFISVNNIEDRAYICNFDVTDVVKNVWYGQNLNNHGFLLKSYDETVPQVIQFFSKESTNYVPKLEIEYFDLDTFVAGAGAIQSDLEVIVPSHDQGLSGSFEVYKENDISTLVGSFRLINNDMINGDLFVPDKKDVRGDFFLWNSKEISGDFTILEKPEYYPDLSGDFGVIHYDPVVGMYYEHTKGSFEVPDSTWLRSDFYIAQNSDINAELLVVNQKSYVNGSFEIVHKTDISCSIGNIHPKERTDLSCDFTIGIEVGDTALKSAFDIPDEKTINADFYVPKTTDIKGDFDVKHAKETRGDFSVVADAKVKGKLEVVIPATEKGLKGSFQAIAQTSLSGDIDIKQDRMFGELTVIAQNSIKGEFFIPEKKDTKGSFVVWKSIYAQGSFEVIPLGFSDLFCDFYLDGRIPVIKSYGFIM